MNNQINNILNQKDVDGLLEIEGSFDGLQIGDIDYSGKNFEKNIDFTGAVFTGDVNFRFSVFNNGANFRSTNFLGDKSVDFSETKFYGHETANFINAVFTGEKGVNFNGAIFHGGGANFGAAKFKGTAGVNFSGVEFGGSKRTYFSDTVFSGDNVANFKYAKFLAVEGADFTEAKFSGYGEANFSSTEFICNDWAHFGGAKFICRGGVNFLFAKFSCEKGVSFWESEFSGEGGANFKEAQFTGNGEVVFRGAEFSCKEGVQFSNIKFFNNGKISFEDVSVANECIIEFDLASIKHPKMMIFSNINLGNTSFYQTDIEDFIFKNVKFKKFPHENMKLLRKVFAIARIGLIDEIWNEVTIEDINREYNDDYFAHVEILYRQLKRNFEEKRDYDRAGDFHFGEMEMKRRQQRRFQRYLSLTAMYKYISGYGQKWMRAISWFVSFLIMFSILNSQWLEPLSDRTPKSLFTNQLGSDHVSKSAELIDSVIYTLNTMTLRKDSRFGVTSSIGQAFTILQSIVGPAILALMFLAIRRQFRR